MRTPSLARIVILSSALVAGLAAAPQRATREQRVVVSVVDKNGENVTGLAPAEFVVRENDVAREVLRVEQASAPMQIELLADTSAGMQRNVLDLRKGLKAFARAIWAKSPDSDITLMEFGERPAQLIAPTTGATVLDPGIDRLFEHTGSGAYFMDAVVDAAAALQKRNAERPTIVAFVRESSPEFSQDRSKVIEDALKKQHASLWVVLLQMGGGSPSLSDEARYRDIVMGDVSTRSGGTRDLLLDMNGIEPKLTQLANRLTSQYVVVYGRPDSLIPPSKLEVTAKRAGARVLAPRWTGQ